MCWWRLEKSDMRVYSIGMSKKDRSMRECCAIHAFSLECRGGWRTGGEEGERERKEEEEEEEEEEEMCMEQR